MDGKTFSFRNETNEETIPKEFLEPVELGIREAMDASPESPTARMLQSKISGQLQAYEKLMETHGLSQEGQDGLLKKVSEYSDY